MEVSDTLTIVLSVVALFVAPVSIGAAFFLWGVHRDDRTHDDRDPKPVLRLSLVLALGASVAAFVATYIAIMAAFIVSRNRVPDELVGFLALAIVLLEGIPILNALFLRWVRDRDYKIQHLTDDADLPPA